MAVDHDWVKIGNSWHAVVSGELGPNGERNKTRCGKQTSHSAVPKDDLPLGSKSCETCLRLLEHDREQYAAKGTPVA